MCFILKILPPVYLHITKIGIIYVVDHNLHKSVKVLISEQYFTLLEWFLLTIGKKIFWADLQTFVVETFHIIFLINKRQVDAQYLINNFTIRSTDAAVRRCSSKQVFLKILQYSQEGICVGISFWYNCSHPVLQLY